MSGLDMLGLGADDNESLRDAILELDGRIHVLEDVARVLLEDEQRKAEAMQRFLDREAVREELSEDPDA